MDNRISSWRRAVGGHPWLVRLTFPLAIRRQTASENDFPLFAFRPPVETDDHIDILPSEHGLFRGLLRIRFARRGCNRVLRVLWSESEVVNTCMLVVVAFRFFSIFCVKRVRLRLIHIHQRTHVHKAITREIRARWLCEEKWSFCLATGAQKHLNWTAFKCRQCTGIFLGLRCLHLYLLFKVIIR